MEISGLEVMSHRGEVTISQDDAVAIVLSIGAARDLLRMMAQALAAAEADRSEWIGEIAPHRYLLVEQPRDEDAAHVVPLAA
jgi:hypothetical protein